MQQQYLFFKILKKKLGSVLLAYCFIFYFRFNNITVVKINLKLLHRK